ncbi:MAG: hypothetical protein KatS3mg096_185 [Candidatus Parcubacteria bacterium]|nr:MAG: hypothetical protein KatS3mg096_185 [Candidatus Parcubacteria bacterium]
MALNSKMEKNKKAIVGLVLTSLLTFSVVPYFSVSAETCNPDALVPVAYGQRGTSVQNAQACLIEAGYDIPAGATGYYGSQTRAAVRAFYADWYGDWSGNNLGPRGVAQLRSMLTSAPAEGTTSSTGNQQQSSTTSGVSQDVLLQVLAKLSAGDTAGALALLLQALGGQAPSQTTTTQTTTTQTTQQQATEGFLTVEQDPTVTGVTLREGETGKVFGLRFRADNGPVTVQSVFLRWDGGAAPHRIISKLEVVDDQNNVLYSRNVDSTTFLQDSNLKYYLPVTGLNYQVQTNQYRSLFVQVTVLNTLPTGTAGSHNLFYVGQNDVRGRDGLGIDRFGPTSQIGPVSVTLEASLAGSAYWVVARNANSPLAGFIIGDPTNGNADKVVMLKFDVTAKNDSLRLTEVSGTLSPASATSTFRTVYLRQGSQILDVRTPDASNGNFTFNVVPANFTINKDQTVTFEVLADIRGATLTPVTASVTITGVKGLNSLGGTVPLTPVTLSIASDVMSATTRAPEVQLVSMTTNYTPPSQTASSSYSVSLTFNVTPRGGTIYMGTTTAPTTFLGLQLQKNSGATSTPNGGVVVQLKQGSTDITNTQPVGSTSTLYQLAQDTTYTFVVTANQNGAPSGTGLGTGLYRWIVNYMNFKQEDTGSNVAVPGVSNVFQTGYTNVQ